VIGIKRIDHIAFATHSIDESARWFATVFGARETARARVEAEAFSFATLELPNGQVPLELIEPIGEDGFVSRFLNERGPGFHHVTLEVSDMDAAVATLRAQGMEPFGGVRQGGDYWRETFIHPRQSNGILFQLYQAPPAPGEHP
jgi:methylmalonyl-CoA/ethylmalonyl-CoA epimerase